MELILLFIVIKSRKSTQKIDLKKKKNLFFINDLKNHCPQSTRHAELSFVQRHRQNIHMYIYCIYTVCSYPTAVDQQHVSNRTKTLKYFTQTSIALHLTCSRQSQQREQAAHRQQRLHFGCRGPSPHPPRLYIHRSGWRSEGMPVVVTLSYCTHVSHCVSRAAASPNHERWRAERSRKKMADCAVVL